MKEVESISDAHDILKTYRDNYWHGERPHNVGDPFKQAEESDKFNVAIFCSASTRNEALVCETENLSYDLAMDNFGLMYGAGKKHMMGAVFDGAKRAKVEGGKDDIYLAGSSTTDIQQVEVGDGEQVEAFTAELFQMGDYFHAKDIYQRMDYMIKGSDAFAIMPGGAGTVQELAALLMLKSEDAPSMRDKPIVVYNKPIAEESEHGFYDTVLKLIPEKDFEALGIKVVTDAKDLKLAFDEAREWAKEQHPSTDGVQSWAHQRLEEPVGQTIH